jgi:hypothetical protein
MTRENKYADWDEDEMDLTIRDYVEENGELTVEALNDPETALPSFPTVNEHYGGIPDCIEQLRLDIEPNSPKEPEYSRSDIIDWIKEDSEDGIAPKRDGFTDSRVSQHPIYRLFGSYTNAVFMAGKEPRGGWHVAPDDRSEEILAEYLQTTKGNYWHGDPDDRWETEPVGDTNYLNPIQKEFPFSEISHQNFDENYKEPDMSLYPCPKGSIDVETQDEIMVIVENSENYLDILDEIEDTDITEAQVKTVLDPESENSFGRWMAENEFPENILPMLTSRSIQ